MTALERYLREFAEAGGLLAYGNRLADVYRLVGVYLSVRGSIGRADT
jgi:hypothetical protein